MDSFWDWVDNVPDLYLRRELRRGILFALQSHPSISTRRILRYHEIESFDPEYPEEPEGGPTLKWALPLTKMDIACVACPDEVHTNDGTRPGQIMVDGRYVREERVNQDFVVVGRVANTSITHLQIIVGNKALYFKVDGLNRPRFQESYPLNVEGGYHYLKLKELHGE